MAGIKGKYGSIGSTTKFFKGLQDIIDKVSKREYKRKYQDLIKLCENKSEQEVKLICYLEFAKAIIKSYCSNEQDLIEIYEDMYDTLQNCLKTKPDKYNEYLQKYPIIFHFNLAVETCKEYRSEK